MRKGTLAISLIVVLLSLLLLACSNREEPYPPLVRAGLESPFSDSTIDVRYRFYDWDSSYRVQIIYNDAPNFEGPKKDIKYDELDIADFDKDGTSEEAEFMLGIKQREVLVPGLKGKQKLFLEETRINVYKVEESFVGEKRENVWGLEQGGPNKIVLSPEEAKQFYDEAQFLYRQIYALQHPHAELGNSNNEESNGE